MFLHYLHYELLPFFYVRSVKMCSRLQIVSWIILKALFTYIRVSAATLLRAKGQKGLLWCGAITQVGSAMGAIVTFFVVNYTKTFEAFYPCT